MSKVASVSCHDAQPFFLVNLDGYKSGGLAVCFASPLAYRRFSRAIVRIQKLEVFLDLPDFLRSNQSEESFENALFNDVEQKVVMLYEDGELVVLEHWDSLEYLLRLELRIPFITVSVMDFFKKNQTTLFGLIKESIMGSRDTSRYGLKIITENPIVFSFCDKDDRLVSAYGFDSISETCGRNQFVWWLDKSNPFREW